MRWNDVDSKFAWRLSRAYVDILGVPSHCSVRDNVCRLNGSPQLLFSIELFCFLSHFGKTSDYLKLENTILIGLKNVRILSNFCSTYTTSQNQQNSFLLLGPPPSPYYSDSQKLILYISFFFFSLQFVFGVQWTFMHPKLWAPFHLVTKRTWKHVSKKMLYTCIHNPLLFWVCNPPHETWSWLILHIYKS